MELFQILVTMSFASSIVLMMSYHAFTVPKYLENVASDVIYSESHFNSRRKVRKIIFSQK